MKLIAIDGVAATTKTTVLKKLQSCYKVHFVDYKEASDQFKLCDNKVLNGFLYALYRSRDHCITKGRHLFDREPCAALLYQLVFNNSSDEEVEKYARVIKASGINERWQSLILLAAPGTEDVVVDVMVRRGNGLDWLDAEYVRRQNRVFKIWARVMGYSTYTVDHTKDLDRQQLEIEYIIRDMFQEYNPLPWYQRFVNLIVPKRG